MPTIEELEAQLRTMNGHIEDTAGEVERKTEALEAEKRIFRQQCEQRDAIQSDLIKAYKAQRQQG